MNTKCILLFFILDKSQGAVQQPANGTETVPTGANAGYFLQYCRGKHRGMYCAFISDCHLHSTSPPPLKLRQSRIILVERPEKDVPTDRRNVRQVFHRKTCSVLMLTEVEPAVGSGS